MSEETTENDTRDEVERIRARLAKRAKAENDERFMIERDEARAEAERLHADLRATEHDLARLVSLVRDMRVGGPAEDVYILCNELVDRGRPGWPTAALDPATSEPVRREREAWQARVDAAEQDRNAARAVVRDSNEAWGDVAETLGLDRDAAADEVLGYVALLAEPDPEPVCEERPCTACDGRGVVALGGCETCGGSGVEWVAVDAAPDVDALLATLATARPVIAAGINADGATRPAVAARLAARAALDRLVGMAAGRTVGVVLSAAEAAVVDAAIDWHAKPAFTRTGLLCDAIDAAIEARKAKRAGRPLASERSE